MTAPQFTSPAVRDVFAAAPKSARDGMIQLRDLIYETAQAIDSDLTVSESLKWGQPSFTVQGGSPLRIAARKDGGFALYAVCTTSLIANYAQTFPNMNKIEGTRAIVFNTARDIDADRLRPLIRHALTYHRKAAG